MPRASRYAARSSGIPHFVEMRGGAYFFLPGIAAIRMLADLRQ
jgi:hypothetical protein